MRRLLVAVILIYTVIINSIGWAEDFDFRKTRRGRWLRW